MLEEYYRNNFRRDLLKLNFNDHALYGNGDVVKFFGGDNWINCRKDLEDISIDQVPCFLYSLFITVTADQCFYTYYNNRYPEINRLLMYPKFGYHGMGPHMNNPCIIIERPIEVGIVTRRQINDLFDESYDLFVKEVRDFQRNHFHDFDPDEFFRNLSTDPAFNNTYGEFARKFREKCVNN